MRVWYRNFEFVSIDEIQEAYNISLYDGWFYDISVLNKFILVKKKFFNDVLEITKKFEQIYLCLSLTTFIFLLVIC